MTVLSLLAPVGDVVLFVHRGGLSVAAPFLIEELGLSKAVMGMLLSAFFWSYSLMQVPGGWAVDRFGTRRVCACGLGLWSLAAAATGFAGGLISLIAARVVLGVGQSIAFPATTRAIANWFPDHQRGAASGLQNFSGQIAGIIAPALTSYIAHKTGSFALAMAVAGALLVVGIAAYWLLVKERVVLDEKPQTA